MPAVGGSIESVDLDGRHFAVAADADVQMKLGGSENEVVANGDGTGRLIKTQVPFGAEGLALSIDDDAGDAEFLQNLTDRNAFFPVAITLASGAVWQGTGQLTGDSSRGTQNATFTANLTGEGKLTQQ